MRWLVTSEERHWARCMVSMRVYPCLSTKRLLQKRSKLKSMSYTFDLVSDVDLVWVFISTALGVMLGLELFRLLFRSSSQGLQFSTRFGCAFAGAFLGTFAGVLLILGYESLGSFPTNYYVTTTLATILAVGVQKFHADQESL